MPNIIHPFKQKFFHLFGVYPHLSFKSRPKSSTQSAQVISTSLFIFAIIIFIYIGLDSFTYKAPLIKYYEVYHSSPGVIIFDEPKVFLIQLQIPLTSADKNFTFEKAVNFKGVTKIFNKNTEGYDPKPVSLADCDPNEIIEDDYTAELLSQDQHGDQYFRAYKCLAKEQLHQIEFHSNTYELKSSLSIYLDKCQGSNCYNSTYVDDIFNRTDVSFYLRQTNIDPLSRKGYKSHLYSAYHAYPSSLLSRHFDVSLAISEFHSDENLILTQNIPDIFYRIAEVKENSFYKAEYKHEISIRFTLSQNMFIYKREYKKFSAILAQSWAIVHILSIFLAYFLKYPMVHDFYGQLAKELFEINDSYYIDKEKKEKLKKKVSEQQSRTKLSKKDSGFVDFKMFNKQSFQKNIVDNYSQKILKHCRQSILSPLSPFYKKKSEEKVVDISNSGSGSRLNSFSKSDYPFIEDQVIDEKLKGGDLQNLGNQNNVMSVNDENHSKEDDNISVLENETNNKNNQEVNKPNFQILPKTQNFDEDDEEGEEPKLKLQMNEALYTKTNLDAQISIHSEKVEAQQTHLSVEDQQKVESERKFNLSPPITLESQRIQLDNKLDNVQDLTQQDQISLEKDHQMFSTPKQHGNKILSNLSQNNNDNDERVKSIQSQQLEYEKKYDDLQNNSDEEVDYLYEQRVQPDLRLNIFQLFFSYFKCKKRNKELIKRRQLIQKCQESLMVELDIFTVLRKLRDIDRLKAVLMNEDQRLLFDALPRPFISLESMRSRYRTMTTSIKFLKMGGRQQSDMDHQSNSLIFKRVKRKEKLTEIEQRLIAMHEDQFMESLK